MLRRCMLAGLLCLLPLAALAQRLPTTLSDEARVSLVTILPGDAVYSAFGHSAFRVHDPAQGLDVSFNYGTFDFADPLFLPRFVYGELDYFLSVASFPRALRYYAQVEQRPVVEQTLALTAAQRQAVYDYLVWNARPENRTYRYDFLFDNCSTRLRAVLEQTLPDEVAFAPRPAPEASFRHLLDPYVADRPWLDLGFDLLLGTPTDRRPTPREATFLPDVLLASFDHATVAADGDRRPLVARTDTLVWPAAYAPTVGGRSWPATLLWALFAAGLVAVAAARRRGAAVRRRWPDVLLFGLAGLLGLVMLLMWFATLHHVTAHNWNVLWAWPTHLAAAVVLARGRAPRGLRRYFAATAVVTLSGVLAWPLLPQALHPAVLPLMLLLALRAAWLAHRLPTPQPAEAAAPDRP